MKQCLFVMLLIVATPALAQRGAGLGAIDGIGRALEEASLLEMQTDSQRQLLRQQHEQEMQRMEREYQLRRELSSPITPPFTRPLTEADKVAAIFPNWRAWVRSQDFKNWYAMQSEDVRKLGASNRSEDVVFVIRKFQAETGY